MGPEGTVQTLRQAEAQAARESADSLPDQLGGAEESSPRLRACSGRP